MKVQEKVQELAPPAGKSVSELVADLFSRLSAPDSPPQRELTPVVRRLAGSLAGSSLDKADYCKHLDDKYR